MEQNEIILISAFIVLISCCAYAFWDEYLRENQWR